MNHKRLANSPGLPRLQTSLGKWFQVPYLSHGACESLLSSLVTWGAPWGWNTQDTPVSVLWEPGFHTSLSVHVANRRRLRRKPLAIKNALCLSLIKLKSLLKLSSLLFPPRWWQQSREQDLEWPSCQWHFIPEPHENGHCGCCSHFYLSRSPLLLRKLTCPLLEHPNTFGREREREVWSPNMHSLWLPFKVHE